MDLKNSENFSSSTSPLTQRLFIKQDPQDEEASDCPLLTPSPPLGNTPDPLETPTMFNPLEETPLEITPTPTLDNLNSEDGLKAFIDIVNSNNKKHMVEEPSSRDPMVESSSSEESSSITKEPVCTQLLTQLNTAYQHLAPDAQAIFYNQETSGKPPLVGIQLVVPKPPKDYSFTRWNWPRIRQACFWLMVCVLTLSTGLVIRGIVSMPKKCAPPTEWWQGKLFYEIFPGSFQDTSRNGVGDIRGITMRMDYLKNLGVKAIRLNSIFSSSGYPEHYPSITSLTRIDHNLGSVEDFQELVDTLHRNGMSLILDFPLHPFVDELRGGLMKRTEPKSQGAEMKEGRRRRHIDIKHAIPQSPIHNTTDQIQTPLTLSLRENMTRDEPKSERYVASNSVDPNQAEHEVTKALKYWLRKRVDGFYLKGLEHYVNDIHFVHLLEDWRDILGYQKILICNWKTLESAKSEVVRKSIVDSMNLLDVTLKLSNGTRDIKRQVELITKSELLREPSLDHPWIHWSIGSIETDRITSSLSVKNATAAAMLLGMMLPGTPSIFYGDELGMRDCSCEDHRDLQHLHNVPPMPWEAVKDSMERFSSSSVMPWLPVSPPATPTSMNSAIVSMSHLRQITTPIFVDSALKHDHISLNCDIRYANDELIVIERWYPRQNTYVLVANLGNVTQLRDLSSLYYDGRVVSGPLNKLNQSIYFREFVIAPGEAFLIKLEK
ncbi:neutral and basic amino acid transport protein rBAT isoform X2 [Fopius arisanus]|uniref:Neutral and basic amino acid transport protein rBAT isoform X2 n=1 Tax=Fopius arisanus TaxID=64838 RepID=A0A0C9RLQ3_9HYME|nr:PREDICTED: neutral and basic amino acid transport protein rBAT-like isoform X2 [Fopius arisanus]